MRLFFLAFYGTSLLAEVAPAVISTLPDGRVAVTCATPTAIVRYTLDGSDPDRSAGVYLAPVDLPVGRTLKARTFSADGVETSEVSSLVRAAGEPSTIVPVTQNRDWKSYDWVSRHESILRLVRTRQPKLIFLGDSITHFFGGEPADAKLRGPEVWNKYYGDRQALNLGYGWDRTENVLWRLQHGEVEGMNPQVAVVMIGTNNTGLNSAAEIATGIRAICAELHRRLPETRILLLAIFPRGAKPNAGREKLAEVNRAIARLDGQMNVTYLDIGQVFLEADGSIRPEIMNDYLHPTAAGYERWAAAMEPVLKRLLGE
ncbi:MAG: chitobiase/beta-hexosaminidase C-terminal domain-containing protein [Bryobacteraceae bacterium]|nr:chitobiase/beta-hexosaminidase C-terminal domain-containing protein [Bryobacteraceae bacterium]